MFVPLSGKRKITLPLKLQARLLRILQLQDINSYGALHFRVGQIQFLYKR
jgi:hypothetical protein